MNKDTANHTRKPTLRYTGVRLRADALVASALQESAGGANKQQHIEQDIYSPVLAQPRHS